MCVNCACIYIIDKQMNNTVVKSNTVVVDTSGKTKRGTKKSGKVDDPAATTNPSTENETSPTPDSTTTTSTPSDIIVNKINTNKTDWHTFSANSSGIYVVVIEIWNKKMIKGFYNLTCKLNNCIQIESYSFGLFLCFAFS